MAWRAFLCNLDDAARDVALEFRGASLRRTLAAGELLAVTVSGEPLDRDAYPAMPDAATSLVMDTR